MATQLDALLAQAEAAEEEAKRSVTVEKPLELHFDPGNLLAIDTNPLNETEFRLDREGYLKNTARDNAQLLINHIWSLPTESVDGVVVAQLPEGKTPIPREKPVPKAKPLTRWEQFAKLKGIKNRKKSMKVWDEQLKEWRPRWGYKRANDKERDWLVEVPDNADPYEDQFAKLKSAKKERVARNEFNRLRNIARNNKLKVPGVGLPTKDDPSKQELGTALSLAKRATASIGKFQESLPKEKKPRGTGKRRKFEPLIGDFLHEKERQLGILSKISNKEPKLDVTKAVNKHVLEEEQEAATEKEKRGGKRKKGGKSERRSKAGVKPNARHGHKRKGKGKDGGKGKVGQGRGAGPRRMASARGKAGKGRRGKK
uniref:ribosome biogenesis regulatory protein homolog n=1 Tax=Myxine glutinosa TaxID=7769 RepID=UPI00358ECDED